MNEGVDGGNVDPAGAVRRKGSGGRAVLAGRTGTPPIVASPTSGRRVADPAAVRHGKEGNVVGSCCRLRRGLSGILAYADSCTIEGSRVCLVLHVQTLSNTC